MKRSKIIHEISMLLREKDLIGDTYDSVAHKILNKMEKKGMSPPARPVKEVRPKDYRWGMMCSMRCNCDDCNPEFIVYEWDKENE